MRVSRSDGSSAPALWWHDGILYQVYVPSFQDGDGDGFGDLGGVVARLDYLAGLGVAAICLGIYVVAG